MKKEVRNNLQIGSALVMLVFGCGLDIAGFCVPPVGEVSDSVLLIFAQCLIYAGSALGIDYYVRLRISEMMNKEGLE